jgi:AcrR family transcriptional regulator
VANARTYRSRLRAEQAAETRQRILRAARELFARQGYAATTVNDVAVLAGVSAQTVYAAFTTKAGIALALVPFTNEQSGADELGRDVAAAVTPYALLRASIHLVCVLHERVGDLIRVLVEAAKVDASLAPVLEAGRRSHSEPQRMIAERLAAAGALHDGLAAEAAAGLLTVSTSPEAVERYVTERHWSYERVEEELTTAMLRALCKPSMARRRCLLPPVADAAP